MSPVAPVAPPPAKQHIEATPGVCGGKPRIAGTRITVWDVAWRAQAGESTDEILGHYPHITLSDVYAALAYYYDNQDPIDRRAAEDDRFAEELRVRLADESDSATSEVFP